MFSAECTSLSAIRRTFAPMITKSKHIIAWMFLLAPVSAVAQDVYKQNAHEDTLQVVFRAGQSEIDLLYDSNSKRIADFIGHVSTAYADVAPKDLSLTIFTGASPEGPAELNRRLGEQRGIALRDLLMARMPGRVAHVTVVNQGARWGELYHKVEQSEEPWRDDVLRILEHRPADDSWNGDKREQQLRRLQGGRVWRELSAKYLPDLRSSGSAVVARMPASAERDTIVIRDTVVYLPVPYPEIYVDHQKLWAVKTNLLLLGVVAPNVQIEIPLDDCHRWSIEGEVFFPWWTWSHNAHAEQFLNVGAELRYWLGNRALQHTLDGWHVGIGLGLGYYDFEWKRSEGWQGEYLNVYCNIGYQHRFGRQKQWLIDGGIGLGYIPTKFRHYLGSSTFPVGYEENHDDHLMWQDSGWKHIIGATHVNVTLGYLFDAKRLFTKNKRKR